MATELHALGVLLCPFPENSSRTSSAVRASFVSISRLGIATRITRFGGLTVRYEQLNAVFGGLLSVACFLNMVFPEYVLKYYT